MGEYGYIYREIGDSINRLRTAKGLSQEKLADILGVTRTSIIHIEKGRQKAPLDKLYFIAEILDVDIFELLPPMKRPKDRREELTLQVDKPSLTRLEEEELNQILNTVNREDKHDKTHSPS